MNPLPLYTLLALAACTVEPTGTQPGEPERAVACGAAELQHLVGEPRQVLAAMSFPASTRIIGPNTAVTMDFNPERLNIRYDEQGTIVEVYCG